jgi:Uma2 family endonuclease
MNVLTSVATLTPEDLLAMPNGDFYELVNGRLMERKLGAKASWVGRRCASFVGDYCDDHHLGWVFDSDASYQCFPRSVRTVRKPDVSFIRLGRLPEEELPDGHLRIPPDLAIEIVSPNDLVYELDEKLLDYLEAKIPLVWFIDPQNHLVHVYRADGSVSLLREKDNLDGETVVPGFRCPVAALFVPPTAPAPNP